MDENASVVYGCCVYIAKYIGFNKIGWIDKNVSSRTLDGLYKELARLKVLYSFSDGVESVEVSYGKIYQFKVLGESYVSDTILKNTEEWKTHVASLDYKDPTMFFPNHSRVLLKRANAPELPFINQREV